MYSKMFVFLEYGTVNESRIILLKQPKFFLYSWSKRCVDKMPTGQNANRTKCQPRLVFCPDFFLWLAFCLDIFLWLAFCPSPKKSNLWK